MKISKREKTMLYFLGLLVGGFLYYQFGLLALNDYVEKESEKKQALEKRYQDAVSTIESKDNQLKNIKILNAKIGNEAEPFYPAISQEHLILELEALMKESGLYGGLKFKDEEVKAVEYIKKSDKDKALARSSIQDIADQYNSKYVLEQDNKVNTNAKAKDNVSSDSSNNSNTNNDNTNNQDAKTIDQVKIDVEFNGTYENVVKFLNLLKENKDKKQLPAYEITMSEKNITEVKGTVSIIAYAIPKINMDDKAGSDELTNYLEWKLQNPYGKVEPFSANSPSGTGIKLGKGTADFLASVRGTDSDLPTVTLGRANDALRNSYVYTDSNTIAEIQMELTKAGDKYYYKYKSDDGSIPANYNGLGNEFTPSGENIEINIQSEIRRNSDDESGLKLKIINNTGKIVNVNVSGEDSSKPRVSLEADTATVHLNKK